ncbi:MAG: sigma-70 family RNA polymerase sigma factor [Saprospiraceae bacterium]|nr:sigma-70 family RNA polymerase sigma factor [Saprospiraceae bacterium]
MDHKETPAEASSLDPHFFREEYAKLVAVITSYLGGNKWITAEDIVQETFLKATEHWKKKGIPPNPQAWLFVTAKHICLNALKREKLGKAYQHHIQREFEKIEKEGLPFTEEEIKDEMLKMMFVCCHPTLSSDQQMALILRTLCGFSHSEIASAFLCTKETINKRLVRARSSLKREGVIFDWPHDLAARVEEVLRVIYLLFNEGYKAFSGAKLIRKDLCLEAIRLLLLLDTHPDLKHNAKKDALLALMYLAAARFEARNNEKGELLELENQDWRLWDRALIAEGLHYLTKASQGQEVSLYHVLATISAHYCTASSYEAVNWAEILALYDHLLLLDNSPLIQMNRCIVLAKVKGPQFAIPILKKLQQIDRLQRYYLLPAIIAEMYRVENKIDLASQYLERALQLTQNEREIQFLEKKLSELVLIKKTRL